MQPISNKRSLEENLDGSSDSLQRKSKTPRIQEDIKHVVNRNMAFSEGTLDKSKLKPVKELAVSKKEGLKEANKATKENLKCDICGYSTVQKKRFGDHRLQEHPNVIKIPKNIVNECLSQVGNVTLGNGGVNLRSANNFIQNPETRYIHFGGGKRIHSDSVLPEIYRNQNPLIIQILPPVSSNATNQNPTTFSLPGSEEFEPVVSPDLPEIYKNQKPLVFTISSNKNNR